MAEKKILSQILGTVKGGLAGIIISLTGDVIEISKRKTISDPEFVRGEFAIIHKVANSLAEDLKLGHLRELILSFDTYTIISMMIGNDYCIILFLDDTSSLGLVRKKMSSLIPSLEKEFYPE
jgi:predicted regulator of Ras-like GTPase activity (Roadblock/LC7/MglB family)